jgi:hypothetical protein
MAKSQDLSLWCPEMAVIDLLTQKRQRRLDSFKSATAVTSVKLSRRQAMPRSNQPSSYRPQYIPAFEPNSDGVMANNSAQTQMMVGMQRLLLEQGSGQKKALESEHMLRRQKLVDRYLDVVGGPDKIQTDKWVATLPVIASPQPIITGLYGKTGVKAGREKQERDFAGSFLAKDKTKLRIVYSSIDEAMIDAENRKKNLTVGQRILWSAAKKADFINEPLMETVRLLDEMFQESENPLRIKWRETQTGPRETTLNLFFVYPNTKAQYEEGFSTWLGSENVTIPY